MKRKQFGWIQRFLRWLFGSPFQELPSEFGDTVPPEWRAFEAEAEEAPHRPRGDVASSSGRSKRTKPTKQDKFLRREQFK